MTNRNDLHVIAARAMLLTLKGSLPNAEGSRGVRFDPGTPEEVDDESAISVLVALPKPVCCGISSVSGIPTIFWRDNFRTDLEEPLAREFSLLDRAPYGRVLLISRGAELLIPAEALEVWRRDYRISSPYTMSANAPTEDEQGDGVGWVLRIYEGADVTLLSEVESMPDLLQALRLFLPE